jgi:hypothetical protein
VKLITSLLAQAATQDASGLLNVLGGGIDTLRVPPGQDGPLGFNATIVLRLGANRSECGGPHSIEIRVVGVDGAEISRVQASIVPQIPVGHPVGWDIPLGIVVGLTPLIVPTLGEYAINILLDGVFAGSLPFRAIQDPAVPPMPAGPVTPSAPESPPL